MKYEILGFSFCKGFALPNVPGYDTLLELMTVGTFLCFLVECQTSVFVGDEATEPIVLVGWCNF